MKKQLSEAMALTKDATTLTREKRRVSLISSGDTVLTSKKELSDEKSPLSYGSNILPTAGNNAPRIRSRQLDVRQQDQHCAQQLHPNTYLQYRCIK